MNKLLLKMTNMLMKWAESKGRVFKITGTAGPDDVYLIRYFIIKSQYFNFFIHQFLRSDRDDLHDHPWDFCTYLVSGAYTENKYNPETKKVEQTRRQNTETPYSYRSRVTGKDAKGYPIVESYGERTIENKENVFVVRKATDLHQVVVDKDLKEKDKSKAALTLFFSGPTKREWGFVQNEKWIGWKKYLGLPEDTKSRG